MNEIVLIGIGFVIGLNAGLFIRFYNEPSSGKVPKMKNPPPPPEECEHEFKQIIRRLLPTYRKCIKCGKKEL